MDCNIEEALRAKQNAEKKMENKDFSGALKLALKAKQLHPDLENISQMILVCEVHCSAETKTCIPDKDWYSILKIEPSADNTSIKKQYKKLALVLHPDKNKFAGSADAFKLIGEAQRVLLDQERRMLHDSKRRAFVNLSKSNCVPKQPSRQSNVGQHRWSQSSFPQGHTAGPQFQNNFSGGHSVNSQFPQQRVQTAVNTDRPTIWTECAFCKVKFQFYKDDVLNKFVHCQHCNKSFVAYEMNIQGATAGINQSQPSFPRANSFPFKSADTTNRSSASKPAFQRDNVKPKEPPQPQGKVNKKRKKKVEESSESSESESSSESEEDVVFEADGEEYPANQVRNHIEQPRRSSRSKRNVSYRENVSDNDDGPTQSNEATKTNTSSFAAKQRVEDTLPKEEVNKGGKKESEQEEENEEFGQERCETNSDANGRGTKKEEEQEELNKDGDGKISGETEPEVYEYPDPDFNDFDKDRREERFAAGQMWAVYDTADAMPRFYAFIKRVLSPGFKLQITWLEALPGNKEESKWIELGLPVSCGKFKRGKSEKAEDLPMFSHLVSWDKGLQRETCNIYPRTGETWALFKNWNMKWYSSSPKKYEYEFVEILSDYNDDAGVSVSYLKKVKGFTCVFCQKGDGMICLIPPSERLRFSHRVPSFRLTGEERGVPKGSYELDPASLPINL